MTAEALKARVMNVLAAWSKWFLFAEEFIFGLEATFLRQVSIFGSGIELVSERCACVLT